MAIFDVICRHVKPKNVHRDEKSKEATTGKLKPKFKLAGNPLKDLDQFVFYILTSNPDAYHGSTSIQVNQGEWINRNPKQPNYLNSTSYIDVARHEVLTTEELRYKIVDPKNNFKYAAELPEHKYREFKEGLVKLRTLKRPTAPEVTRLLARSLEPLASDLAKKLGI